LKRCLHKESTQSASLFLAGPIGALLHELRQRSGLAPLNQLVENHARIHVDVWDLDDPGRQPLLLRLESGFERIGLEVLSVFERLIPLFGSGRSSIGSSMKQ
jgi:hypothetical protein